MPSPKFIVSSRATKGGPTQQVTIPAAIARKLPQGASIRWEVSVVKGGLFFKYLGPNTESQPDAPEVELDFVPASDLKAKDDPPTRKKPEKKVAPEVKAHPETVIDGTTVVVGEDDPATDSTAEQAEDEVIEAVNEVEALDEAPF